MTSSVRSLPADVLRRCIDRGAGVSETPDALLRTLPFRASSSLPPGWDDTRLVSLCRAALAPDGPEPALVRYEEAADLTSSASTHVMAPLSRGSMVVTSHVAVKRDPDGVTRRHRKTRHGLVVALAEEGAVEVLWSPWLREAMPA